jgi:hypothetical protein
MKRLNRNINNNLKIRIMKQRILLSAAFLMIFGVFVINAQQDTTTAAITDYSVLHENTTPLTYIDSVTAGRGALSDSVYAGGGNALDMVMPYFVMPDSNLNAGFDNNDGTFNNGNLNSSWAWSFNGPAPTDGSLNDADFGAPISGNTDTLNQIFVDWGTATGNFRLDVQETSNPTGCAGSVNYITVDVIDYPTAIISNANNQYCESTGAINVNIGIELTGKPPFEIRIDSIVNTINPGTGLTDNESVDYEIITTGSFDGSTTGGGTLNDNGNDSWTFNLDTKVMRCINGRVTERIYRVTGVNGRISRKSDRATPGNNLYYLADDDVTNTAYPTPSTGNIYNIDN